MIDDFEFDVGDRFTYEYNFFEHWIHDIRVKAIYENTVLYKWSWYARSHSCR
ncbi:plasmid pRiA4b ORF-3 family protein [Escherichia coli]|uniref:plasmid pRiA4b ORF-3 family protein n=1 Tax=Escherichia coli TaxID=562 RepID=UPI0021079D48|nr:plasmid pRiA4b ORF-3 family protein [Escherichia coli]MCQ1912428.1 plasmid pRiA4b ORF-3 family protein [Escherichia coli]